MNVITDPSLIAPDRFAVGQSVSRREDPQLLRGEGRYTDDLNLPGQAYGVMVRSRLAHGVLRGIETATARAMPGVLAVLTASELAAAGIGPMPVNVHGENHDGRPVPRPAQPPLAADRVRYVGDPVAMVVAETETAARDAAELVFPEIDPLPAVTDARAAAAPDAPRLYDAAPGNVLLDWHYGDADAVAAAFARAAHVTRLSIRNTRVVVCAMEPRAALAEYDPDDGPGGSGVGRYVLRLGCQGVFGLRNNLAAVLGVPRDQVRVLTGHVGGSFGMKATVYPEYIALLHAARALDRPVKWTESRTDSFLSDSHGRDHDMTLELALDARGNFLAVRATGYANIGACLSNAMTLPATMNIVKNIIGVYGTPLVEVSTRCMFTNTTPVGPYRGAGRPEGNYYMERLVATAAREMRIDQIELRRRNHIGYDAMPYVAPSGMVYDSGDFGAVLDRALAAADWDGYAARVAESAARGRVRGRGIGQYLEVTAPASAEMGGIRFDGDGGVTIVSGTLDYGQGHAVAFAQVLHDRLGIPIDKVRLEQGDSDQLLAGGGTGGSRSMMNGGAAVVEASDLVIARGRAMAAHVLEAAEADIEFAAGRFSIAGTDRGIGILDLAAVSRAAPAGWPEELPRSLDVSHVFAGAPSAFPNGCHVAEVELDPETGVIEVVRYTSVNDFGLLVNPMLVEGQAHGGIAQGIGQALTEHVVYDADGQLLSGSYMDYALPRADAAPALGFISHPVPARTNPLGVKGCGEAGCAGALPAVMNAVADALSVFGVTHLDMPATPLRVWEAIRGYANRPFSGSGA